MKRRDFLRYSSAAATLPLLQQITIHSANGKPNVVFFYIDDLGWKDLSFMSSQFYETPNVDRLAKEGMAFTDAYANAPNCAPSRACLLTGMYSPRHGVYTVGSPERGKSKNRKLIPIQNTTTLDPSFATIAEVFDKAGYTSAHMGKWHLGKDPQSGPKAQGYDVNFGGNHRGSPPSYFSPYKNPDIEDGPKGEHLTERTANEGEQFIRDNSDSPFFLMMSLYAVHTPLQGKKELIEKYKKKEPGEIHDHATYAAMIESMDHCVGQILNTLDDLQLTDNTIVIFLSDNGGYGPATSMKPLRGAKGMLYEGGIRVPLVVRWPKMVQAGSECHEPVIGVDFMPTFLDILNAEPIGDQPIDGKSFLPLLKQDRSLDRDAIYWHFPAYLQAYHDMDVPWRTTPASAIRKGEYKLIEFFEDGTLELYNLKEDISESNNLVESQPNKAKELHGQLKSWRNKVNAPIPTQLNPEYEPDN